MMDCVYTTNTVYDVVVTSADHNLLSAVDTCGLIGTSGPGPFVVAPTDAHLMLLVLGKCLDY